MKEKNNLIHLRQALSILRISESDFHSLVASRGLNLEDSELGPALKKADFNSIAYSADIPKLSKKTLLAEARRRDFDTKPEMAAWYSTECEQILSRYTDYLGTIQRVHAKYNDKMTPLASETAQTAAYILLAQAIAFLRVTITCLRNNHLQAIALLRTIDEAVNIAEYFMIERHTDQGTIDLQAWFRENRSPSQSVCRASIDNWIASLPFQTQGPSMKSVMRELYDGKSKSVHNAHHSIMDSYLTKAVDSELRGEGFDYGMCGDPRKLYDLVGFFQSSIWTVTQTMSICFTGLTQLWEQSDREVLLELNHKFLAELEARKRRK